MKDRGRSIQHIRQIPRLPAACVELIGILRNPETGINDIVEMIELDPGLSMNLLKLVNSASMAGRQRIGTVKNAVVRLGRKQIQRMVLEITVSPMIGERIGGYDITAREFWLHSIAVSLGTRLAGERLELDLPGDAETAGLLHDIGKIAMSSVLENDAREVVLYAKNQKIPFEKAEETYHGISHPEAGAILLEEWHLPDPMIRAVRWHHEPENAEADPVVDMIHIADVLSISAGLGMAVASKLAGRPNYSVSSRIFNKYDIVDETTEQILSSMVSGLDKIDSTLKNAAAERGNG
mgnify:CR=1 FL=1